MSKNGKTPKGTPPPPVTYYEDLLLAFVRGRAEIPVENVQEALDEALLRDLHTDKFKRKKVLPRVEKTLELLKALKPTDVLDVGCGRGTALWPMMEAFPSVPFTGVDAYEGRSVDLRAMRDAGITQIADAHAMDAENLSGLARNQFDVATILEVLEHLETPEDAVKELIRVTRRAVVMSVPSVPDWNPDHLRVYTAGELKNLWLRNGAVSVTITEVPKHFVAVATLRP